MRRKANKRYRRAGSTLHRHPPARRNRNIRHYEPDRRRSGLEREQGRNGPAGTLVRMGVSPRGRGFPPRSSSGKRKKSGRSKLAGVVLLAVLVCCLGIFGKEVLIGHPGSPGLLNQKKTESVTQITVYQNETGKVETVDLEEHLKGVVTGEMPANFDIEALKAQAVAARTFIIRKALNNAHDPDDVHKGADVCDDPAHCKAYRDPSELSEENRRKIAEAVDATRGEIMVYDGEPINAVFFSMSGGKTENSVDVWGGDLPYLKSVDSSVDENAPNFETEVEVSVSEFQRKVAEKNEEADFNAHPLIGDVERSEGGSVKTAVLGGASVKGSEIRTMFGLRSANFTMEQDGEAVKFQVKGYGHGVGMSQWGANFLGQEGKTYDEILKTYYQDIKIETIQ